MPKILPLPTSRLHATFDPERIPWQDSREIPLPRNGAGSRNAFQPRAMQALDMALNIRACGYNVYVSGDANLGRSYTLLSYLGPQARKRPTPPDLVYVHNFDDPDRPRLLSLPAGQGKKFKQCVTSTVDAILHELPRRFEAAPFVKQRARLVDSFQKVRSGLLSKMTSVAQHKGFQPDPVSAGQGQAAERGRVRTSGRQPAHDPQAARGDPGPEHGQLHAPVEQGRGKLP